MLTVIIRADAYCYGVLLESGHCRQAPEMIVRIAISELCICALIYFLHSVLVCGPVVFSSYFTGFEDIAACGVLLPLPEGTHSLLRPVEFSQIMSDSTVNPVEALLAYSPSIEVDWLYERCAVWYL